MLGEKQFLMKEGKKNRTNSPLPFKYFIFPFSFSSIHMGKLIFFSSLFRTPFIPYFIFFGERVLIPLTGLLHFHELLSSAGERREN